MGLTPEHIERLRSMGASKEALERAVRDYINQHPAMETLPQIKKLPVGANIFNQPSGIYNHDIRNTTKKQVRFKNITMQGNPGISEEMAYQLLAGRLRISEYEVMPFAHISMHMTPEKAILFVVTQGGPVIIEDPMELYPSDSLVTQLRMLIG
jgi:hypothetical protein